MIDATQVQPFHPYLCQLAECPRGRIDHLRERLIAAMFGAVVRNLRIFADLFHAFALR